MCPGRPDDQSAPVELHADGNCIFLALYRISSTGWDSSGTVQTPAEYYIEKLNMLDFRASQSDQQNHQKSRSYEEVSEVCSIPLHPFFFTRRLVLTGQKFLIHCEAWGSSHCIPCTIDMSDNCTLWLHRKRIHCSFATLATYLEDALDKKLIVCFATSKIREAVECSHLLSLRAGAGDQITSSTDLDTSLCMDTSNAPEEIDLPDMCHVCREPDEEETAWANDAMTVDIGSVTIHDPSDESIVHVGARLLEVLRAERDWFVSQVKRIQEESRK